MAVINGAPGDEILNGTAGDDTFLLATGGDGDNNGVDVYNGGEGIDSIVGGWAKDVLHVTNNLANLASIEVIDGGDSTPGRNTIIATSSHDTLDFTGYTITNFVIDGAGGNDVITGAAGDDQIRGGAGDDTLNGGAGDDTFLLITGGDGDNNGVDVYDGGEGIDSIVGGWAKDVLHVTNNLANLTSIEVIDGGDSTPGRNTIIATSNHDTLDFAGYTITNFVIDGAGGNDVITGAAGDDQIRGNTGNDAMDGGDGSDTYLVDRSHGADRFNDAGGAGDTDTILATNSHVDIGVSTISGIERIDGNGKSGVDVVGTANHQTLDFSGVTFSGIGVVDALGGNDVISTSDLTAQAYRGGAGHDIFHLGDADAELRVSAADNGGFDSFDGNTAAATHRLLAETAGTEIGVGKIYNNDVDVIDGDGMADVSVVGSSGQHNVWDLSETVLRGIDVVDTAGGNDTIWTSNYSDAAGGQAYRGGKGHDSFHLGDQDTRLLVSSDDNGGFDSFDGNTVGDGVEHRVIAGDAGTQIGVGRHFDNDVDVFDGGGMANVSIVGSSGQHDVWDLSRTTLNDIVSVETGGGNDKVQTALDTGGAHVTYDGGAYNGDTLVISLTAAQAADSTLINQIAALTPGSVVNGTLNAAGVRLTAENFENFEVQVDIGGDFQPLNFLYGTANHDNGNPAYAPELTAPSDESWAIFGRGGDDVITGGAGADFLNGEGGNDVMRGGDGDDTFGVSATSPANGFDWFFGDGGTDAILSTDGSDIRVRSLSGIEEIDGNGFGALLVGTDQAHVALDLSGTTLTDIAEVYAGAANNVIWTSSDSDAAGGQAYRGGMGNDSFHFGTQDTRLLASSADNGGFDNFTDNGDAQHTILAEDDGVTIGLANGYGGANSVDAIDGGGHDDVTIVGSRHFHNHWDFTDTALTDIAGIYGGDNTANDVITGSAGGDNIFGLGGNDRLGGGEGNDALTGGAGADSFVFTHDGAGNLDTIMDYGDGADRVDLGALLTEAGAGNNAVDVEAAVALRSAGDDTLLSVDGQDVALLIGAHTSVDVLFGGSVWLDIA
ncbi:calcium-binding protein [Pikeienuella sp. HZG-20]|uniref:beta strand repeat-containing protein n=1 Tax=Paludibacillus litoralis TaxID=3133267 RepID=UPI0030EB511E